MAEQSSPLILSEEEWDAMWEAGVQRRLGISGDEFIRRYHAGVYDGDGGLDSGPLHCRVIELVMMAPARAGFAKGGRP